eukprot:scaffold12184_cov43-Phaeocystis_antarctica.AAC.3
MVRGWCQRSPARATGAISHPTAQYYPTSVPCLWTDPNVPVDTAGVCLAPARSRDACLPLELPAGDYTLLPLTAGLAGAAQPDAPPITMLLGAGAAAAAGAAGDRQLAVSAHAVGGGGGGAARPQLSLRRRSVTAAEYEALLAEVTTPYPNPSPSPSLSPGPGPSPTIALTLTLSLILTLTLTTGRDEMRRDRA